MGMAVLLARLQPTPPGSVFLDGIDVCDLPLAAVRQTIGYAQQNAFLFSTTVGRNIGFSLDDPDEAEAMLKVEAAAREACIEDEVLDLPDGFDTVVGERGVQLHDPPAGEAGGVEGGLEFVVVRHGRISVGGWACFLLLYGFASCGLRRTRWPCPLLRKLSVLSPPTLL